MEAYQDQAVKEKQLLDARIAKLALFLKSAQSFELKLPERDLLKRQIVAMGEYSRILFERIECSSEDSKKETFFENPLDVL